MRVDTTYGPVEGVGESGVFAFRGIPYAAPPVAARRFRPPEPPESWSDARPATTFGPQAPQNLSALFAVFGIETPAPDEDCLTLNVWTPDPSGPPKPVMVWIHGGAFIQGSAGMAMFEGGTFARDGVVLVSMNYRLGALGFLHLAGIDAAGAGSCSNLGMLDQLAALEWVRDNIERFGGDPGDVTIFGESAGAASVAVHLTSPAAKGLFHRAVLQSGALQTYCTAEHATDIARRVLTECGIDPTLPLDLAQLNALPVGTLLAAQKAVGEVNAEEATLNFSPVFDGVVLPHDPMAAVVGGSVADVPLLMGTTRDELTLSLLSNPELAVSTREAIVAKFEDLFGDRAGEIIATYESNRPGAPPNDIYCAVVTDRYCRLPAARLAEAQLRAGGRVHMFEFAWPTPAFGGMLKACHGLDVPFVFDHLDEAMGKLLTGGDAPQTLADAMHSAWVAFAKTGDPGWPTYDSTTRTTMVFDDPCEVVDDLRGSERRLWDAVI